MFVIYEKKKKKNELKRNRILGFLFLTSLLEIYSLWIMIVYFRADYRIFQLEIILVHGEPRSISFRRIIYFSLLSQFLPIRR